MSGLKERFIVSLISVLVLIVVIFFSNYAFMKPIVTVVLAIVGAIAIGEFWKLCKVKEIILPKSLLITGVILEIVSFLFALQFSNLTMLPVIILFIFLFFIFLSQFKKIEGSLSRISAGFLGLVYVAVPIGMLLAILFTNNITQDGRIWLFYLILVTKITDVGAYFSGKLLGKRKLAPEISPNKTIVGSIGGLACALIASIIFALVPWKNFNLELFEAIYLGLLLGIVGQFGDLFESLFKRDAKVKDSNTLPGLGGLLDMLDSLMFNIPIMYFFLMR